MSDVKSIILVFVVILAVYIHVVVPKVIRSEPQEHPTVHNNRIKLTLTNNNNNNNYEYGDNYNNNNTLLCTITSERELTCTNGKIYMEDKVSEDGWRIWVDVLMSLFLVLFSGIMSGLTMGLMSMDITHLKIVINSGEPAAQRNAKAILPLVKKHHLLLVTLLIGNSISIESLPIFLDRLLGGFTAIILSVTLVLIFGEIIPQAICTRYGLAIGANLRWLVWLMIAIFFVIAYPLSKLLDFLLGESGGTYYRRAELKELVDIHEIISREEKNDDYHGISKDEVSIIKGALDLKSKTVEQVMTPIDQVAMLSYNDVLDYNTCRKLMKGGHSRWPVYLHSRENIVGMLLVKKLISLDPKSETPIRSLRLRKLPKVTNGRSLFHMLKMFQQGKSHMAIVLDEEDYVSVKGIITLEDVVEELIGQEILDETDTTIVEEKIRLAAPHSMPSSSHISHFSIIDDYNLEMEDDEVPSSV